MKVVVHQLQETEEERVEIYAHSSDSSINKLKEYVEEEHYKSVKLRAVQGEMKRLVDSHEILYIEMVRDWLELHTSQGIFQIRQRMYEIERKLPDSFIRISKSAILNLDQVRLYQPAASGLMRVILKNGEETFISRKYLKDVKTRILGGSL